MLLNNNHRFFIELVKAGLWEKDVQLMSSTEIDYKEIYRLAEEQSVVGLVTAGLEHLKDAKPAQDVLLSFIGSSLQIEQRNKEMNLFIADIVEKMRKAGIYGLLVKGSSLAQCYSRPLWRSCGDVDFFFSDTDYRKAKEFFLAQEKAVEVQNARYTKSYGVVLDPWFVELHGTLRNGLSSKMDIAIDVVQRDIFYGGNVRSWINGETTVFLPGVDDDLFLLFTHFIRHFYKGGIVIKQICDWCRYLWTYSNQIDIDLLKKRLQKSCLMKEWQVFAAVAINYLGMPKEAMPFHNDDKKIQKKSELLLEFVFKGGEFGKMKRLFAVARCFPCNTVHFIPGILLNVNTLKLKERLTK